MFKQKELREAMFKNYLLEEFPGLLVGILKGKNKKETDAISSILRENAAFFARMLFYYKTSRISEIALKETEYEMLYELKKRSSRFHQRKWKGKTRKDKSKKGDLEYTTKQYTKPNRDSIRAFLQSLLKRLAEKINSEATRSRLHEKIYKELGIEAHYEKTGEHPMVISDDSDIVKATYNYRKPQLAGVSWGYIGTETKPCYAEKDTGYRIPTLGTLIHSGSFKPVPFSYYRSSATSMEDRGKTMVAEVLKIHSECPIAPDFVMDKGIDGRENFRLFNEQDISAVIAMNANRNIWLNNAKQIMLDKFFTEFLLDNDELIKTALLQNTTLPSVFLYNGMRIKCEVRSEELAHIEIKTLKKYTKDAIQDDYKYNVAYFSFLTDIRDNRNDEPIPLWINCRATPLIMLTYKAKYAQYVAAKKVSVEKMKQTKKDIAEGKVVLDEIERYLDDDLTSSKDNSKKKRKKTPIDAIIRNIHSRVGKVTGEKVKNVGYFMVGVTKERNAGMKAFDLYKKRWDVEVMFRTLKNDDIFKLKDVRLQKDGHLDVLLLLIQLIMSLTALFMNKVGVMKICAMIQGGNKDDIQAYYNSVFSKVKFMLAPMLTVISKIC